VEANKAEPADDFAPTHYVGMAGIGKDAPLLPITSNRAGVFGYNRKTRIQDMTDGTSNTIMISEASKDYGAWGAGGTATIRSLTEKPYINGPDGIGGPFPGGCNVLLGDGSVRFISRGINPSTFEALITIRGGEAINDF
jgi:prepilin-type processing-associated H-X9-DG protein